MTRHSLGLPVDDTLSDFLPDDDDLDEWAFLEAAYEDDGEFDSFEDLKAFDDEDVDDEDMEC